MLDAGLRAQELNPAHVPLPFRCQVELCRVPRGETLALVSDVTIRPEHVAAAFAAAEEMRAS